MLFKGSVGRTDFAYGSTETLLESIRTKLMTLDDGVVFICGHGGPLDDRGGAAVATPYVLAAE